MNPDDMDRRNVVRALTLAPAILPLASLSASAAAAYSPKFFSAAEFELVATLGELILPQTETPGARAAKAHEHIDLVLSEEIPEIQRAFRNGLAWVEQRSQDLYGQKFLQLAAENQNSILMHMAASKTTDPEDGGHGFFLDLRRRVVFAYYTSEIGLHQELNYKGKQALSHWEGCPHADRHGDSE